MLHQISWTTYGITALLIVTAYYGYIGLTFYSTELKAGFNHLTGNKPAISDKGPGDLQLPDYSVMGVIQADDIDFVNPDELNFGPGEENESSQEDATENAESPKTDIHLLGDFSEMIAESKTLIRVINESEESKENFEMLFRLIVQRYPALTGSIYEKQVNDYLINEGAPEFPFPLSINELESFWTNELKIQSI
jgi:hypothetical protein